MKDCKLFITINGSANFFLIGKKFLCINCKKELKNFGFFVYKFYRSKPLYNYYCQNCVNERHKQGYFVSRSSPVVPVIPAVITEDFPSYPLRPFVPEFNNLKNSQVSVFDVAYSDKGLVSDTSQTLVNDLTKLSGRSDSTLNDKVQIGKSVNDVINGLDDPIKDVNVLLSNIKKSNLLGVKK